MFILYAVNILVCGKDNINVCYGTPAEIRIKFCEVIKYYNFNMI